MTLIVDALNRIARQCSVTPPSSWITATRNDHVELRDDFLPEAVDDIIDRVDLPGPIAATTQISGTGAETYRPARSDFKRMQRDDLAVYDSQLDRHVEPITNDGMWVYLKDIGTAGIITYYRLRGYEGNWTIDFYEAPASPRVIDVNYITTNWKATAGGTAGKAFNAEDDVLLLPRRVVEAGAVWRFRERRGLPYQDKYNEYEMLLARLSNDSRGRRKVSFGEPVRDVRWQDQIPAFIPPE